VYDALNETPASINRTENSGSGLVFSRRLGNEELRISQLIFPYTSNGVDQYETKFNGQSLDLCLNVAIFSTPVLIRHMWQLKKVVFIHWCLIRALL